MKTFTNGVSGGRALTVSDEIAARYKDFFAAWASVAYPITRLATYDAVEYLAQRNLGGGSIGAGKLCGRVISYEALIYINQELRLPKELWDAICHLYE